ncbi:transposase [Pseudonocardia hierapolitana]|uniref:transposase n=1 Tax=Pseudonocardia hierapolitana TaxID=1128676 RepID=UPI0014781FC8
MPAPHPPEFRQRAVELARQRTKPVAELAKERRISESWLRNWMAQADAGGDALTVMHLSCGAGSSPSAGTRSRSPARTAAPCKLIRGATRATPPSTRRRTCSASGSSARRGRPPSWRTPCHSQPWTPTAMTRFSWSGDRDRCTRSATTSGCTAGGRPRRGRRLTAVVCHATAQRGVPATRSCRSPLRHPRTATASTLLCVCATTARRASR